MDWKTLKPGRERLIYALGMMTGEGNLDEEKAETVFAILTDMFENCDIYEKPSVEVLFVKGPAEDGEADEG